MRLEARNIALVVFLLVSSLGLPYLGLSQRWAGENLVEAHGVGLFAARHPVADTWAARPVATDTATPTFTATVTQVATGTTTPTLTPTSTSTPVSGPSVVVKIRDFAFRPNAILIQPGTTVVWYNLDNGRHTVTSDTGEWASISLAKGQSGFHTFNRVGSFTYHCSIHPSMRGKVMVVDVPIRRTYLPAIFRSFRSGP